MGRLIPVPLESEKSLSSPRVRGKLTNLTSAKCRDQEVPLHPVTMQELCSKASLSMPLSTSASLASLLLVLCSVSEHRLLKQHDQTCCFFF